MRVDTLLGAPLGPLRREVERTLRPGTVRALEAHRDAPLDTMCDLVLADRVGNDVEDDVALLLLKIDP
jgi:hypothetical protein